MDCRGASEKSLEAKKEKSGSNTGALPNNPAMREGSGKSVHAGIGIRLIPGMGAVVRFISCVVFHFISVAQVNCHFNGRI